MHRAPPSRFRQLFLGNLREVIPAFDGATRLTAYLARWLGGD